METKWIVCDLGKVLVDFDHDSIGRRLRSLIAVKAPGAHQPSDAELARFFFETPRVRDRSFNQLLDRGEIAIEDVARQFCSEFAVELDAAHIRAIWSSIFRESNPAMLRFLVEARTAGARLALCSNTNEPHWTHIVENYPEVDLRWDALFLSFRMGKAKTDAGFFEDVRAATGAEPGEHFLIDDLAPNVFAAQQRQFRGLVYTGQKLALGDAGLTPTRV